MAFTKKTVPQQFRLQWKSNGEIQGCDYSYKEQVFEEGELYGEKYFDTIPVAFGVEDSPIAIDLSEVVEGINNQLVLNVSQLQMELSELRKQISDFGKEKASLENEISELRKENEKIINNIDVKDETL